MLAAMLGYLTENQEARMPVNYVYIVSEVVEHEGRSIVSVHTSESSARADISARVAVNVELNAAEDMGATVLFYESYTERYKMRQAQRITGGFHDSGTWFQVNRYIVTG
jgi:hypothetical protein